MVAGGPRKELTGLALIGGGVFLVAMSVAGYFLGDWVGRELGNEQLGAIIGLLLGTIVGFWDFYRIASRVMSQQPMPTEAQQRAAKKQWEKSEKYEESERDREGDHE